MTPLHVTYRKTGELIPYARNARTHSQEQVQRIAASIKEFGFTNPILVDGDNGIIAGHGRLAAAQLLKLDEVPTIELSGMSETQKRAYILADNKLALDAGWDDDLLAVELEELKLDGVDLSLTGFTADEIDELIKSDGGDPVEGEDDVPDVQETTVSKLGDIWILGDHRLMCGDSTDAASVAKLMNSEKADMVFTDPPYGVSYTEKNEFLNQLGNGHRITTPIENDSMSPDQMRDFWGQAFALLHEFTSQRMSYYITAPQGGDLLLLLLQSIADAGFELKHQLIWNKNNHVLGRCDYNYKHEPIIYGWKKGATHKFYGGGKFKTSVWDIPKPTQNKLHPTMKPVELIENAVLDGSSKGQIVIDLFGGSGSTLIACEKAGRGCRMMELSPHYCDVIVRRWQEFTGRQALHAETTRTFGETEAERLS